MSDLIQTAAGSIAVEQRGTGPAIVFIHGNSSSRRAFEKQFAGTLADSFRLIAIDLPGHGDSPKATSPERTNTLPGYADALLAVASELDATSAVFVGWSLGGHILLEASDRLSDAAGFLITGTPPVTSFATFMDAVFPEPALGVAFREDSTDDEIRSYLSLFVRPGSPAPAFLFDDFVRTDNRARAALAASAGRNELRDEAKIVAELAKPLAVVHGEYEAIVKRDHFASISIPTLWRGAVQLVPDAGHAPHWENPREFDRLLEAFARDCY
jgi:pimeloyl-ACP methyl ester carboxylesterase